MHTTRIRRKQARTDKTETQHRITERMPKTLELFAMCVCAYVNVVLSANTGVASPAADVSTEPYKPAVVLSLFAFTVTVHNINNSKQQTIVNSSTHIRVK